MSTSHDAPKPDIFAADTAEVASPLANFAEQQVALYRLREAQRKANEEAEKAETKASEERAMKVASEAQIDVERAQAELIKQQGLLTAEQVAQAKRIAKAQIDADKAAKKAARRARRAAAFASGASVVRAVVPKSAQRGRGQRREMPEERRKRLLAQLERARAAKKARRMAF